MQQLHVAIKLTIALPAFSEPCCHDQESASNQGSPSCCFPVVALRLISAGIGGVGSLYGAACSDDLGDAGPDESPACKPRQEFAIMKESQPAAYRQCDLLTHIPVIFLCSFKSWSPP